MSQRVTEWRRQMAAGGIERREVLDELESHLRDEIESQIYSGADEQHAYQAAVVRMGAARALEAEFANAARGDRQERPTFMRIFYFTSVALMLLINAWTLLEYELSGLERVLGGSAVAMICLYLACLPQFLQSHRAAGHDRLKKIIKLGSTFLWVWPIGALLDAEHIVRLDIGIVPILLIWCLFAAMAMTVFAYGLDGRSLQRGGSDGPQPPFQPDGRPLPPTRPCPPDLASSIPQSRPVDPIVHQSLEAACGEASRLGHNFIGTEHVLLGLLKLAKGPFASALRTMGVDCDAARVEVERLVFPVPAHITTVFSLTPRAQEALRLAAREAAALNHSRIGAEHLFLGLLLEGGGIAARALRNLGIHIGKTRKEILNELRAQA